ncbi:MAG: hypothetical protein NC433_10625 [Clostridiales bacterium]|nr:hypothetical protein [Clostridiales bacterium]
MSAQTIGYSSEEDVIQNLKDAGCDTKTIECFMKFMEHNDLNSQLELMDKHRQQILDQVHKQEKQIDCLDYLVYQIVHNSANMKR